MPKTLQLFLKKETFLNQNKSIFLGSLWHLIELIGGLQTIHLSRESWWCHKKTKVSTEKTSFMTFKKELKTPTWCLKVLSRASHFRDTGGEGTPKCYLVWSKAVVALALNWIESKHNFLIDNCHAWTLYTNMIVHVKRKTLNWAKDWEKIPA